MHKNHQNIDIHSNDFRNGMAKVVKTVLIVIIFLGLFYLLTVFILNKDNSKVTDSSKRNGYNEILVGSSFSLPYDEYFVLYYESDSDQYANIVNIVENYAYSNNELPLFTADLTDGFNKNYVADEAILTVFDASDLRFSDITLVKYGNHSIIDFVVGIDNVQNYLS